MAGRTFIVLFRGVGGETKLPTQQLREALTKAGFGDVRTYIATGNAVLQSNLSAKEVRTQVAKVARRELGFTKEIFVVTFAEWAKVVAKNPFPQAEAEPRSLHAFLLHKSPSPKIVEALKAKAAASENIAAVGKAIYFLAPEGFGRSKLPTAIERAFGGATTARNWRTVAKLAELAKSR